MNKIMSGKIGILTFQNTKNYGAVLQSYALQRFLQLAMKCPIEVINYFNEAVSRRETPVQFSSLRGIKQFVKFLLYNRAEMRKLKAVNAFCKQYIAYSEKKYLESDHPNFEEYDAIIAGSDQIWNLCLTDGDVTYMLNGFHGKGYSYAASIGRERILTPMAIEAIRKLRLVSVREENAQFELRGLNIESELVCDPTFLLNKEEWVSILPKKKIKKKYLLLYQMTTSESLFRFAQEEARQRGVTLINANPISLQLFKSRCIRDASPLEWLSLIYNAEFIVTNSFHGLAFSINFEKEFYTEIRDNEAKNSSRISSLLNILGLCSRNIASPSFSYGEINYNQVTPKLEQYRTSSFYYIDKLIKDIKNE